MIVPQYWAEGRAQHRGHGRTIILRRYGWSDSSQDDAQAMADRRAREALDEALAGSKLPKREPKVPYNGAHGVPIREEIISRHGTALITRNSYGARCLNTPDVLFVDVDFDVAVGLQWVVVVGVVLVAAGWVIAFLLKSSSLGVVLTLAAMLSALPLTRFLRLLAQGLRGGPEADVRHRIDRFMAMHPGWGLRLYRTPAGLRLLATHRTFSPNEPVVTDCFEALGADPVYAAMCRNQQCFRARLSAKPWRIGISGHLRPRPGVWPVAADKMPMRQQWIAEYEARAGSFAACGFVAALGSTTVAAAVRPVIQLHDSACRALDPQLPLA